MLDVVLLLELVSPAPPEVMLDVVDGALPLSSSASLPKSK